MVSRTIYRLAGAASFKTSSSSRRRPLPRRNPHTDFVKRCVGTPGDVVEVRRGTLFRGGKAVPEIYQLWNSGALPYDMKIVGGAVYSRDYYAPNAARAVDAQPDHRR